MLIYAWGGSYEDALQVVVFCAPHIAFIAHLHVLTEYIVRLRSHGVVRVRWRSQGKVAWKRVLFGDADEFSETKGSTYIVSSQVGRSSLTIQDVVIRGDIVPIDHAHIQGRREWLVPRGRQTRRELRVV